jgi:hypothetical protein
MVQAQGLAAGNGGGKAAIGQGEPGTGLIRGMGSVTRPALQGDISCDPKVGNGFVGIETIFGCTLVDAIDGKGFRSFHHDGNLAIELRLGEKKGLLGDRHFCEVVGVVKFLNEVRRSLVRQLNYENGLVS